MVVDAVVGLALVGLLLGTLAAVRVQHRRTMKSLETRRFASQQLELAAARLHAGAALQGLEETVKHSPVGGGWTRLWMSAGDGEVELFIFGLDRERLP